VRSFIPSWRAYLHRIGSHQSALLLALVYIGVVVPTALARRILRRPSLLERAIGSPVWHDRVDRPATLDDLRRMY
jgi:hypothetical protein